VAIVDARFSVWEALSGRAPGRPLGPADPGVWAAVAERVNPAKARPRLRAGIEQARLTSVRGTEYVMLRSPDGARGQVCYVRLDPAEVELTRLMDGTRTLARLVAEFVRISGRLAPDQVRRVVADLAGNRMLEELPVDAFRPLQRLRRRPWPLRLGAGMLAFVQGRRVVVANIDPVVGFLYRAGGRLFFTPPVVVLLALVALVGLGAFGWQWWAAEQSVFLAGGSYVQGAAILLGLNVLALACHELGHGLATKRAGRRVPAGGFLVYFGIPSVFVDTTDVWMAGRRARLRTTIAGPATGLVLAAASAIVGLLVPAAAPWCFKLSFAWYVNALFNLNPFLALDGYYLLMDWLEVPNLRARGLAWVAARLRRRPPRFKTLDREGRLVALYGLLSVGWLLIAANIAYRVWADRVAGLAIGLWRQGLLSRLLLVTVAAALAAPMVYVLAGWLQRRWRRLRERLRERHDDRDVPRRLDVLAASSLRDLPPGTLATLAAVATWTRPRAGEQVVFAGAAQPRVFAVAAGVLEGRAPGDPSGTVRERIGKGGVIGLGCALTGAPSALAWHAVGATTLLAVPAHAVAQAVHHHVPRRAAPVGLSADGAERSPRSSSPASQPASPFSVAEVDAFLAQTPALAGLSVEDRLGLATAARGVQVAPGTPITLDGDDGAKVIVSGWAVMRTGENAGRGALIGPGAHDKAIEVGRARTPVNLLVLPAVSGLALLLGASASGLQAEAAGRGAGRAPAFGVHPPAAYPPLAVPPGPPRPGTDAGDRLDRRFERRLRWLLVLVLLFGFGLTGANLLPPVVWAEMPADRALLHVERGGASAVVDGEPVRLPAGADIYLGAGDTVEVAARGSARLTYRGGAESLVCAGTAVTLGRLVTRDEPPVPTAALRVDRGLVVTDTTSASAAFRHLRAVQQSAAGTAVSTGRASFAVAPSGVRVASGELTLDGARVPPTGGRLGCGNGGQAAPQQGSRDQPVEPAASAAATAAPSASTSAPPSAAPPSASRAPGASAAPPSVAPPSSAPPPPRDTTVPRVTAAPTAAPTGIYTTADGTTPTDGDPGSSIRSVIRVAVQDAVDAPSALVVTIRYRITPEGDPAGPWQSATLRPGVTTYTLGPFQENFSQSYRTYVDVEATVRDAAGNVSPPVLVTSLVTVRDYRWG
jgi:putative peptide zinc metalloprotease protein